VEELKETRDFLESLFTYSNVPIIVWDSSFTIERINPAFEHLTGYSSSELIGKKLEEVFPRFGSRAKSLAGEIAASERWEFVEISITNKDGRVHTALWNSANIYTADGKTVKATIAQGVDVTERKRLEEETKKQLQALTERDDALRAVENPLLEVVEGVIVLPLIGIIDSRRALMMTETLLNTVAEKNIDTAILDLTGIMSIDTSTANHLLQTIEAVKLMGVDMVITGIRPDVAMMITRLGVELKLTETYASLKDGIKRVLKTKQAA
jgi:rsbT co-antagonist protein RsbR